MVAVEACRINLMARFERPTSWWVLAALRFNIWPGLTTNLSTLCLNRHSYLSLHLQNLWCRIPWRGDRLTHLPLGILPAHPRVRGQFKSSWGCKHTCAPDSSRSASILYPYSCCPWALPCQSWHFPGLGHFMDAQLLLFGAKSPTVNRSSWQPNPPGMELRALQPSQLVLLAGNPTDMELRALSSLNRGLSTPLSSISEGGSILQLVLWYLSFVA